MVAADLSIGDRVRHFRQRAGKKQDVLAGLVGISTDYLSQIERNLKVPTIQVLQALARELGVPVAALLAESPLPDTRPKDTTAPAIAQALMGYGPPLSAEPVSPAELRERVEAAWRVWQSSPNRFTEAGGLLPALIADTEHAVRARRTPAEQSERRDTLRVQADLYFLLRSYLRRTGRVDLSLMAADRAVRAAEEADDALRIAAAQWNLGHVLLAADEPDGAEQVALRGAEQIHPYVEDDSQMLAMEGALQLVAVVAAARRRDWWAARERLKGQAVPVARVVGEGNVMWTCFGPTNVELHNVSIEMESGEAAEALRLADEVDATGVPSLERAFTFSLEVANCHNLRGDVAAALLELLELEKVAPEDLARAPLARDIVLVLGRRARPRHARQAEQLAERLGVL